MALPMALSAMDYIACGSGTPSSSAELAREIAAHPRMDLALLVEEAAGRRHRKDALVPDAGMDVDAEAAVRPEGDEVPGPEVVAGQRHRHDEGLAVERPEELAAVGMVVAMPQQHAAVAQLHAGPRHLGQVAKADDIVSAHRFVAAQKLVAAPFAGEDPLGRAAFDAGAGVEPAPAGKRPGHDLDPVRVGIAHDLAVALERFGRRAQQRHVEDLQARGKVRVQIVDDDLVHPETMQQVRCGCKPHPSRKARPTGCRRRPAPPASSTPRRAAPAWCSVPRAAETGNC